MSMRAKAWRSFLAPDGATSKRMQAVGRRNTPPEVRVQRILRRAGIRYRTQIAVVGTKPDLVLPQFKVALFVDGCFWHGCPVHYEAPRRNQAYWLEKIARNRRRDRRDASILRRAGWGVVRIWECRVHTTDIVVGRIICAQAKGQRATSAHPRRALRVARGGNGAVT